MGFLDVLTGRSARLHRSATQLGIVSPWSTPANLPPAIAVDILGEDVVANLPLARAEAITIPAVSKARNLLISTIAKFPLKALDTNGLVDPQPSFLYRTDSDVTPYERMAWTIDDLIFHGYSLWAVSRGARDRSGRGPILRAEYVPFNYWTIRYENGLGIIHINDEPVSDDQVILFNSPFEGLLNIGGRTIRGARDTEAAWVGRARNPIPLIDLHLTDDDALKPEEVQEYVDAWSVARRSENGAIGSTPPNIQIQTFGEIQTDLMVEGRNAIRTDIGSFLNIRASMLDGTIGIDSLTYTTSQGEKNAFYEFDLPFWTDPIEARLSMDDVVPRGQRIRFDKYEAFNLPTPTGPIVED